MGRYSDIRLGQETIRKHHRDISKDAVIRSLLPLGTPLKIFESSAGKAQLSRELAHEGHDVVISNYKPKNIPGLREYQLDLNLPLESQPDLLSEAPFDAVICREVIEHVESVPHVLRNFRRLLKPCGVLVLTFPNRLQIRSRFRYLWSGFYRGMKSPINLDVHLGEAHINLVGVPEMDYFLRKTGFAPTGALSSQVAAGDYCFLPLVPVIRMCTRYCLLHAKKNAQEHDKTKPANIAYNTYIARTITSLPLLLGKDVIMGAVVSDSTGFDV